MSEPSSDAALLDEIERGCQGQTPIATNADDDDTGPAVVMWDLGHGCLMSFNFNSKAEVVISVVGADTLPSFFGKVKVRDILARLGLASKSGAAEGWPTPEMLRAGMEDLAWWAEPHTAPRESGVPTDSDLSQEEADFINTHGMDALRSAFLAMLAAAPGGTP